MPLNVAKAPSAASPLWIIALCIALSEATAGITATATDGIVRMIFTCFATGYPVLVFAAFVWLLVRHTPKLYSPPQFSKDITPEMFRAGIGISRTESINLARAVAAAMAPLLAMDDDDELLAVTTRQVAQRFETAVSASSVTITLSYLKPGEPDLRIPVTDQTSVTELLDGIYLALIPAVPPDSYQRTWTLIDGTGAELPRLGKSWAIERGMLRDERPIADAGIFPGGTFTAVPLHGRGD